MAAILLLGVALAVRVAYVLHTGNYVPTNDDRTYDHLARGLVEGRGWYCGPCAYHPPGYPIFLAGVYELVGLPDRSWTGARLVEAVLSTLTIALIGVMVLQVAGRRAMLISLAIGAAYVPLVLVGVSLMSESLFVPLLLAAINCALRSRTAAHRYRWIWLAGGLCGLAALTRANGLFAGLALIPLVWTGRPRRSRTALLAPLILLTAIAIVLTPWTIRNFSAQHRFVLVSTELGPTLTGTYNDLSAGERFLWRSGGYSNYAEIKHDKRLTEAQRDSRLVAAVIGYLAQHPTYLPEAVFWNTLRLVDLQGRRVSRMTARTDEDATPGFADLGVDSFWLVAVLAIAGTATRAIRRVPYALWLTPLALWAGIAPVTTGTPRFRSAFEPFVILSAALAIEAIAAAVRWRIAPGAGPALARSSPSGSTRSPAREVP